MAELNIISIQQYQEGMKNLLLASELEVTGLYTANLMQAAAGSGGLALQDTVQVTDMIRRGDYFDLRFASKLNGMQRMGRISLGGIIRGTCDDRLSSFNEGYFKASEDETDRALWDMCERVEESFEPIYIRRRQPESLKRMEMPLPE